MKKRMTAFILALVLVMSLIPAVNVFADDPIPMTECSFSGPEGVTYTGKLPTIKLTIKYNGKTLKEGTDYKISYEYPDKGAPGTLCYAWAQGMGNYYSDEVWSFLVLFKDVPLSHRYSDHVYWASNEKCMAGYSGKKKGTFGVGDDITRGQMVTTLWRYAGKPEPKSNKQTFQDVPTSHSFYKAIQWAYEEKITGGYTRSGKKYFEPNEGCTRGQMVTFLWRFMDKPEPKNTTKQKFTDVPVKHNFFKPIQWAYEIEVTDGYSDGSFGVNKVCTRGHCATFLHRMNEYYSDEGDPWPEPE